MISSSQRPLPDNTQHSQQKNIHAPCGIRTHNLSRRAAADPRLRPRGHWDWQWRILALNDSQPWNVIIDLLATAISSNIIISACVILVPIGWWRQDVGIETKQVSTSYSWRFTAGRTSVKAAIYGHSHKQLTGQDIDIVRHLSWH